MFKFVPSLVLAVSLIAATGCGVTPDENNKTHSLGNQPAKLSVLYAGSMTKVMEEKIRPDANQLLALDVQGEGKGSTALAQMIHSGIARPDVFISAAPSANTVLMGDQNHHVVDWYMTLAQDQLVIAYAPKSRFKAQLDSAAKGAIPWYNVLGAPGFRLGRTDPLLDPKGANTIFLAQLASTYYHQPNLSARILGSNENPSQVFPEETLLAQLTSGQVDAIIAYRHEAVEWGTPFIALPDAINLGNAAYAKTYAGAHFSGKDGKVEKGAPILFTITIPSTTANPSGAESFVKYMLSGPGHDILMKDGFSAVQTKLGGSQSDVPQQLKGLIQGTMK